MMDTMEDIKEEAIKDDVNNKTEILTMNGVEIMSDIVSFILSKAKQSSAAEGTSPPFRRPKAFSEIHEAQAEDAAAQDGEAGTPTKYNMAETESFKAKAAGQYEDIDVTAIEAETLLLSMKAIDRLLKDNTQSFSEIRLEQRIEIFTKMTQILNLSVSLQDFIQDRDLEQLHMPTRKQQTSVSHSI